MKYKCVNDKCKTVNEPIEIDISMACYHRDFTYSDWNLVDRKFVCVMCGRELEQIPIDTKPLNPIGKFGISSKEDKMSMLKRRAHDTSIDSNKRDMDKKKYLDEFYTGTNID